MTEPEEYSLRMGVEGAMSETALCACTLLALFRPEREKRMKPLGIVSLGKLICVKKQLKK